MEEEGLGDDKVIVVVRRQHKRHGALDDGRDCLRVARIRQPAALADDDRARGVGG